jgi:NTE family protein
MILRLVLAAAVAAAVSLAPAPALPSAAAEADSVQTVARPRIGLALGGGGARGGAHIGVLKVLEELRVPVDYVAGTSMGSIVGALFSIGLTPAEIEADMKAVDWDDLFSDTPRREMRTFRRKEDDSSYFLPIEFGVTGRGIVMAPGVIAGQKLSFAFPAANLYLAGHESFDDLGYPYRPVATDLATGEMVVLGSGNLLKAVRASMSIPGVFPPVDWNGRQLVDGYLARNLPVDVVRNMGADIVIAVDVGVLPDSTDVATLHTLSGISDQMGLIQARQNVDPQVAAAEIVIRPNMPGISTRHFHRTVDTIPLGEAAARELTAVLAALSVSEQEYAEHVAAHRLPEPEDLVIDRIDVASQGSVSPRTLAYHVRQPVNEPLDLDLLKRDLTRLYDFGVFELVDFSLSREGDDDPETVLTVEANRKFYEPHTLHMGLAYEGGETGRSSINLRMRLTSLELNERGAELRNDLQLGRADALRSEYYQPLDWNRRFFASLSGNASAQLRPWYFNFRRWGEYKERDIHGTFALGLRLGHVGELRGGILYGHIKTEDRTGLSLAEFNGARGGYTARLAFDMMDAAVFPRHGYDGRVHLFVAKPGMGSGLDYSSLTGLFRTVTSFGADTFGLTLQGGSSLGTEMPEFALFTLGGIGRLSGYTSDVFRGEAYGVGALNWYHRLGGRASPYTTRWYVGAAIETGGAWRDASTARMDDLRTCGSAFIGAHTLFGPLIFTYARANDGNDAFYITLGRIFELTE